MVCAHINLLRVHFTQNLFSDVPPPCCKKMGDNCEKNVLCAVDLYNLWRPTRVRILGNAMFQLLEVI